MDTKELSIGIAADLDMVAREVSTERIIELVVHAPEAPSAAGRHPLNLGLVLDRSGSMKGDKLSFVKHAAVHVLDLLDERDQVALVVYDDQVDLLSSSRKVTPQTRESLKHLINSVDSGNTTFLSGGWLAGCEQVAAAAHDNSLNHTLLLTDGLANVGIQDPEILAQHAFELSQRRVTTSTFGVGRDYNHQLLEAMANQGGGNYYFIETPNDIPGIFKREFQELANVTAQDVEIAIELPAEIQMVVLGDWRVEHAGNLVRINLGNLRSDQHQKVYLESQFPAAGEAQEITVKALVRGKAESGKILEAETILVFRCANRQEVDAADRNTNIMDGHAQVKLAQQTQEALKLESEGRRQEAFDLMNRSIQENAPNMPVGTVHEYQQMSRRMLVGMDEIDRKQSHYRGYLDRKQRAEFRRYTLERHDQRLMIVADGRKILIDTGSPVSIGREAEWYFIAHHYDLTQDNHGITPQGLSSLLGTHVDVLLGLDILKNLYCRVDTHDNTVTFNTSPLHMGGTRLKALNKRGIPVFGCKASNMEIPFLFGMGTRLTLLPSDLTTGRPQIGISSDFHPVIGKFETPVYQISCEVAGKQLSLQCGTFPVQLEKDLLAIGAKGMIGTEIYDHLLVEFAFPDREMYIEEYG